MLYNFSGWLSKIYLDASAGVRVERMEAMLKVVMDYNDDILSVVFWSLSAVFGITLVLIGFNWFQSSRILRREFDSLREELSHELFSKEEVFKGEIESYVPQIVKKEFELYSDAINVMYKKIKLLELGDLEMETRKWLSEKVPSNAVYYAAKVLEKSMDIMDQYKVGRAIDLLNQAINLSIANKASIDATRLSEVESIIKRLGEQHATARRSLLTKLEKSQFV